MAKATVDVSEVIRRITVTARVNHVKLEKVRRSALRLRLGVWLFRLAARVTGMAFRTAEWEEGETDTEPPEADWYQVFDADDLWFSHKYFNGKGWGTMGDDPTPIAWRRIPPLPTGLLKEESDDHGNSRNCF